MNLFDKNKNEACACWRQICFLPILSIVRLGPAPRGRNHCSPPSKKNEIQWTDSSKDGLYSNLNRTNSSCPNKQSTVSKRWRRQPWVKRYRNVLSIRIFSVGAASPEKKKIVKKTLVQLLAEDNHKERPSTEHVKRRQIESRPSESSNLNRFSKTHSTQLYKPSE